MPKKQVKVVESSEKTTNSESLNPFTIPKDDMIFKDKDAIKKLLAQPAPTRQTFRQLLAEDADDTEFFNALKQKEMEKVLITKQSKAERALDKERLYEFVNKKRDMFLIQYALNVKKDEMRKLEEMALREEEKLINDEKMLEEDAARFDAFLKENDKNSVEAIKSAELETKAKLEKIQEAKRLANQISSVKSEISRNEDILKDLEQYKMFLENLGAERQIKKLIASSIANDSSSTANGQQDHLLKILSQKVKEVYDVCIGEEDTQLSTLQMLSTLESHLERLLEIIENIPPEKVEKAEKLKEKERRLRLRQEKLEQQKHIQEERVKKAMERAKAPIKKRVGKPIHFRSEPPQKKENIDVGVRKEEDDSEYYWA